MKNKGTYLIEVNHMIQAAHQLPDSKYLVTKECANLHGHSYAFKIKCQTTELKGGMVIDFKAIKGVLDILDHKFINDIFKQFKFNYETTAENIARFIYKLLNELLQIKCEVSVCEGYKNEFSCWITYKYEN